MRSHDQLNVVIPLQYIYIPRVQIEHIGDIAPNQDWFVVKKETNSREPACQQIVQSKESYEYFWCWSLSWLAFAMLLKMR